MTTTETPPAPQLDLRRYAAVLWRWKWLFLAVVVAVPAAAYAVSARNTKVYQSSVLMQVQAQSVDMSLFASGTTAPVAPQQTVDAAARLVTTSTVANAAGRYLRPPVTNGGKLLHSLTVTPDTNAGFITIKASSPSPTRAAAIANAFGKAVVATRARQAVTLLNGAIDQLQAALQTVSSRDASARSQLSSQLQRFRALRAAQGNNAEIIQTAVPSSRPVSPRPVRAAIFALIIAIALGLGLVIVAENLDRRLRDPEELEPLTGLPLLSMVPERAFGELGHHREEEAFHTLRASITYFNIDRSLSSILVASPLQGDGKTTVAANLALAFARAGKHVILLDADLRRSGIAGRLGLDRSEIGLGRLLVADAQLDEVLLPYELDEASSGRLQVMLAGPTPPNPSELLASRRMERLVKLLHSACDLVIIDTSPMILLSDAIPLLPHVSGVIMVSRVGATSRDSIKRATKIARASGAVMLGNVVTGTGGSAGGYYGYYDRYVVNGKAPRRWWRRLRPRRAEGQPAWPVASPDSAAANGGPDRSEAGKPQELGAAAGKRR